MALQLKATVSGTITLTQDSQSPKGSVRTMVLAIRDGNASPAMEAGQTNYRVESPAAFESLGWPVTLAARVFALKVKSGGPFQVRLTHNTAGQVTTQGIYQMLVEVDEAEAIEAVAVRGEGEIEWVAFGPNP